MNDEQKYVLELNVRQLRVVSKALDLYSRLRLGQTWVLQGFFPGKQPSTRDPVDEGMLDEVLQLLGRVVTGARSGHVSWGIGNTEVNDDARVSYDIRQVIDHRISWDKHPEGGFTTNFDTPMKWGGEALPTIKKKETE